MGGITTLTQPRSSRRCFWSLPLHWLLPVLTQPKARHFDRSCSQSYREQRSGEIRFSTPNLSQPTRLCTCGCPPTHNQRVPHPSRTLRWVGSRPSASHGAFAVAFSLLTLHSPCMSSSTHQAELTTTPGTGGGRQINASPASATT